MELEDKSCNQQEMKFYFLTQIPTCPKPYSTYFIKNGEQVSMYVTNKTGDLHLISGDSSGSIQLTSPNGTIFINGYNIDVSQNVIDQIISVHNQLTGLQGGQTGEYFHLTQAQWEYLAALYDNQTIQDIQTDIQTIFDILSSMSAPLYNGNSPTTVAVQNIPAGTNITGYSYDDLFQNIYAPFVTPTIPTFSIQSQSQTIEVGTTITGSKNFLLTYTNSSNINPNSLKITDVTNSTDILTGGAITSPVSANVGTVQKTVASSHSWRASVTATNSSTIQSPLFTVSWQWRVFNGTSNAVSLNENQIENLENSALRANQNTTYTFAAGGYKYIAYPDSFGSPTAITGFKDTATNLAVVMADSTDDAFYSNVQNGWSYGIVSVTNALGATTNYRLYRTKNILGGSINIQVS